MPECTVCGGTDFICESGFYYCLECQTQSQDIRQTVLDDYGGEEEVDKVQRKRKRSSVKAKEPAVVEENMTSWEGLNFALVGLVNELISLGASPDLKKTVLQLWTAYLAKLEVAFVSKTEPAIPKLGPNYKQYDAEIIYGYSERKAKQEAEKLKKKHDVKEDDVLSDDGDQLDRKRVLKHKRKAIKLDYERTLHEMSLASQTLTDVTLEMLSASTSTTPAAGSEENHPELQFSAVAEELKDKATLHSAHPGILSRAKLIVLLYLGLLITRDKIKLSDLLRWMWEGHLSYSYLMKFFPPEVKYVGDTYATFGTYVAPSHYKQVVSTAQHLGSFIGVQAVKSPCLTDMVQHYTAELNLPAQVCLLGQRLLALLPRPQSSVKVSITDKLPIWEGIAMSSIIVALKLLFGLDDFTENRNSRVATRINELITSQQGPAKLFVWEDWVHFCTLRQTAFLLLHDRSSIESSLSSSSIQNIEPLVALWKERHEKSTGHPLSQKHILLKETQEKIVTRMQNSVPQYESEDNLVTFPPCLSPFTKYTEIIIKACQTQQFKTNSEWGNAVRGLNLDVLRQKFSSTVVDYLTHPESYVEWAQQHGLRVGLHNGSGVSSIKYPNVDNKNWTFKKQFHRVKLLLEKVENIPTISQTPKVTSQNRSYSCHKPIIYPKTQEGDAEGPPPTVTDMEVCSSTAPTTFKKPRGRPKSKKQSYEDLAKEDEDNMLHTPHTEYWMLHSIDSNNYSHLGQMFSDNKKLLPKSFLFLLQECALLLEMEPAVLYKEVTNLEVILKDLSLFGKENNPSPSSYNLEKYGKEMNVNNLKGAW